MKNKKVMIILSVVAIVVTIAIIIGVLYFTTDIFKTNKQLFFKYISNIDIEDEILTQKNAIVNNKLIKSSSSSTANIDVKASIQNKETGVADIQEILNIKSNGLKNVNLKQEYKDFSFSSNNQQFLTLKYMRDDNTYAISADNILSKYLAVENNNLKDFFAKLGVQDTSMLPNSIPTNSEEILKIDEETLNALMQTYGILLYNNINEENFYKIDNQDSTQAIGISLSEQEAFGILKLLLETAKSDEKILNLIIEKAQIIGYADVTVENIQIEIQKHIDEIDKNEYSEEKDFFRIYLIKKNKVVTALNLETNYIKIEQEPGNLTDNSLVEDNEKINNKLSIDFSELNKITISLKENDAMIIKIILNCSYDDNVINYIVETEQADEEKVNYFKMKYQINNYQTDNITRNYTIYIGSNDDVSYQVNISNQTNLKQDINIEKLTTDNSAKLNDMTKEELSNLFTAIVARIVTLYGPQIVTYVS